MKRKKFVGVWRSYIMLKTLLWSLTMCPLTGLCKCNYYKRKTASSFEPNTYSTSVITVSRQILSAHPFLPSVFLYTFVFSVYGESRLYFCVLSMPTYCMPIGAVSRSSPGLWVVLFFLPVWSQWGPCTQEAGCQTGPSLAAVTAACPPVTTDLFPGTTRGEDSADAALWGWQPVAAFRQHLHFWGVFAVFAALSWVLHLLSFGWSSSWDRLFQWETTENPWILSFPGVVNILSWMSFPHHPVGYL